MNTETKQKKADELLTQLKGLTITEILEVISELRKLAFKKSKIIP